MDEPVAPFEATARAALGRLALLYALDSAATADELRQRLADQGHELAAPDLDALAGAGLLRHQDGAYALTDAGRRLVSDSRHLLAGTGADVPERAALDAERAELERLHTDFLATVSHELRTPLTLIRTSSGLLLDSDPDAIMRARLLHNIKQSADRMHALVNDLLDLARSRHEQAGLHLRQVALDELVFGVIALMKPLFAEKDQQVELALPAPAPWVLGDFRRLERVVLNLLSNANKFTPVGGQVRVSATVGDEAVTIAVRDTGPGISPEAQAKLWNPFYTARTTSAGHGLGLPIARGIVEAHGGHIWVESAPGQGSTFAFTLPNEPPLVEEPDEVVGRG
ncbi:MAG TPA: HAMP domain-containing sensor histidine kinase [Chloroflexota bacterium]|nr:HAMP domain-containing sensor histidine kinase [Chloroflexota bacterium]